MKITLSSVIVNDQARALRFYTEVLGFVVKTDIPTGEHRWLTVASPEGVAGVELLLEPDAHPAAREFQKALHRDGIPATSFESADIGREYGRLVALGVTFRTPPTPMGPVTVAVFDDTCGNLIQLHQAGGPEAGR
jgi:catechol 2,3-dioxygenase-like lactoylglutathione lyase family enzyme